MKRKSFILQLCLAFLICTTYSSCKKSSDPQSSFTWTFNGINYTANFKEAYLYSMAVGPIIIAGTGTTVTTPNIGPRILVNSFSEDTYVFASGAAYSFTYIDDIGNPLLGDPVTLNITNNEDGRLSGNFSGQVRDGSGFIFPISGNFSNVIISN